MSGGQLTRRSELLRTLAETLGQARVAQGRSLSDVGGNRISAPALHKLERGLACPTAANLVYLVERLGLELEHLLPLWASCRPAYRELYRMATWLREHGRASLAAAWIADVETRFEALGRWKPHLLIEKGLLRASEGAYVEAIEVLREAARAAGERRDWPCRNEALYRMGIMYRQLCRPLKAVRCFMAVARANPQGASVALLRNLAATQAEVGALVPSIQTYEELAERVGTDHRLAAEVWEGKAVAIDGSGNPEVALALNRRALRYYRDCGDREAVARVLNNSGICHKHLDEWKRAVSAWEESLSLHPGPRTAIHTLVEMAQGQLALGNLEKAQEYIAQAEPMLARYPYHPERGALALLRGRLDPNHRGQAASLEEWSKLMGSAEPDVRAVWVLYSIEAAIGLHAYPELRGAICRLSELVLDTQWDMQRWGSPADV